MTRIKDYGRWFSLPLLILPATYVLLILLTVLLSLRTYGGAFYRIIGVNPVAGGLMMIYDNAVVIIEIFLISGTPWWYFIGRIGWDSKKRRIGRLSSSLGAILALFSCWAGTSMTTEVLKRDIRDGILSGVVILQYSIVGILCLGAFISAIYSAIAALKKKEAVAS